MAKPQQDEFLAEAREHLTDVCDQLLRLERASGDEARQRVEQMFRAVHSIKGGAGFFGLRKIEQLAHRMETVLETAANATAGRDPRMIDVLLGATDRLAALLDDVDNSNDADIGASLARLDELLVPSAAVEPSAVTAEPSSDESISANLVIPSAPEAAEVAAPTTRPTTHQFELALDLSRCEALGVTPAAAIERVLQIGQIIQGRIETSSIDLGAGPPRHPVIWQATIASELDEPQFITRLGLPGPVAEAPSSAVAEVTSAASSAPAAAAQASSTIRIPVELVDHLMALAGELVLVRNQSRRYVDADQPLPGQVLQRLDTVTTAFQETVLQTRMQPVGNLFNKFPRLVRDLSRQLDKQLELRISGAEVELDKTILDALSDPLTHLVRNACDHGIESGEARQRAGKPAAGTLQLAARHFGDQIWITIQDDGRGIDREAVRRKALQQKLRTAEELARLDDRDLLALILLPGFSTAAQVTDVSGRGVGMDVVKTNLARLGGGIEIDSRPGEGTTFTLRLPLTLAIIPTLLVAADGERYAIPQKDLEELVFVDPDQPRVRIERTPEGDLVRLRDRLLPLVRLTSALHGGDQHTPVPAPDDAVAQPLLFAVVRAGSRRFGLVVDSILTSEEIVVKPLHSSLRRLTIYSGATVLGDGRVALILNTEGIAQVSRVRFHAGTERATQTVEERSERQSVLVVRQLNGEPLAYVVSLIRRIVMITPDQIEHVGADRYVTIDEVPTRLIAAREEIDSVTGSEPLFVVLPRDAIDAIGFVVREVLGTEEIELNELHLLPGNSESLGAAVIDGKITPLADLGKWLKRSTEEPQITPHQATGVKILLVDDTQFFRDVVGRYLIENGYHVTTAEDGAQALAILPTESFDIVVSDLEMPVMDGWTLANNIRKMSAHRDLPLLSLSTLSGDEAQAKSRAAGFNAHEVKLDRASLLATIRRLLGSVKVPKEVAHA